MILSDSYKGSRILVLGLGRSGLTAAAALRESGAEVIGWDDSQKARLNATAQGIFVQDPSFLSLKSLAGLVLSPGIPFTYPAPHPLVNKAKAAGIPILSDIDLLFGAQKEATYVGITGTNGKTTTTSMIGYALSTLGRSVQVGGNIGTGVLSLDPLGRDGLYVIEVSSYQLELMQNTTFDVAVLLNITPDHLARHGDMDGYVDAKRRIFMRQRPGQLAVVGVDDPRTLKIFRQLKKEKGPQVVPVSMTDNLREGIYLSGNAIVDTVFEDNEPVLSLKDFSRSQHPQNVMATYAVLRHLNIRLKDIQAILKTFRTLPHRQEIVATVDDVTYVNDSKATNMAAVTQALDNFDNIYLIFGGRSKGESIRSLTPYYSKIKQVFLIGESMGTYGLQFQKAVETHYADTLECAIRQARDAALKERDQSPVVLLSPGCESFDQFKNYEDRGDTFKSLVKSLPGFQTKGIDYPRDEVA